MFIVTEYAALNHVWFLDKFQFATFESKGIAIR